MIFFSLLWIGLLVYAVMLYRIGRVFRQNTLRAAIVTDVEINHSFSIIVAFRNEAANIQRTIDSIAKLNYPANMVEVLFVDDHSEDNGPEIVAEGIAHVPFPMQLLQNKPGAFGKKPALELGIQMAKHNYILTTDADCLLPPGLLLLLNQVTSNKKVALVAGPVVYESSESSFLCQYQRIENAGLITMAAVGISQNVPFMANGANLCFKREVFDQVSGYDGNLHVPGGDDEYLLEKVHARLPGSVAFLYQKHGMVKTSVQKDLAGFVHQRVRWASKAKLKKKKSVFLLQLLVLALFISTLFSILFVSYLPYAAFVLLAPAIKLMGDLVFYYQIRDFFDLSRGPKFAIVSSFLQLLWIPWIAFKSLGGNFHWKERPYRL